MGAGSRYFHSVRVDDIVNTFDIETKENKFKVNESKPDYSVSLDIPSAKFASETDNNLGTLLESNPWIPYVGDCKALDAYLDSKSITWIVPKFLNALFRGISQVLFANNPLTGLIILLALFWCDLTVGLATIAAATTSIITALLMRQELSSIRAGLTTYNGVLVGCVTASLWYPLYSENLTPKLWAFIIVGSMLSVFINSGVANVLSSYKFSLPSLTVPFNIVNILLFICLMPPAIPKPQMPNISAISHHEDAIKMQGVNTPAWQNETAELSRQIREIIDTAEGEMTTLIPSLEELEKATEKVEVKEESNARVDGELDWGKLLTGVICSMGQVFAVESLLGSILIFAAILVYSPILCLMCLYGATLSTLTGLIFTGTNYATIYAGIWGYNGILSAAAVGGFFIAMTCHSFLTATANVLFTVILQHALVLIFSPMRLPVFTLPFVLSTLIFLSVSSSGDELPRVTNITFPEMHRYEYLERMRMKRLSKKQAEKKELEEKELVLKDVKVIDDDIPDVTTNGGDK